MKSLEKTELYRGNIGKVRMQRGLNESISSKMSGKKNRSFQFQTYSMKFQDSISNLAQTSEES